MSSKKNSDALQGYFNDLLGEDKHRPSDAQPQNTAVDEKPESSPKASRVEAKTSQPISGIDAFKPKERGQFAEFENLIPQAKALPDPAVRPLMETPELQHAQKEQLQKLLNQQSLELKTQDKKPELKAELKETSIDSPDTEIEVTLEADGTFHNELAMEVEWAENGRPEWAQSRFEALLFDVSGLTLAVPLVALGQIVPIKDLTPIFGQSDWFMGLLSTNVGQLRLVNTSLFVMPEKYSPDFVESASYAISLDGVPWALAVNKVNQPISLEPDEIKWRTERSKRPWLAGTVKSAMCALLDVPHMAQILTQSDPKTAHSGQ